MLSVSEICEWAGTNPSQRNFREGENILKAGHLISCGTRKNQIQKSDSVKLIAYCLQTSQLRAPPHEIAGEISAPGKIISISCSCKAGLGEKCKHILATLLYCHRINISGLEVLSSTDTKCMWKNKHKESLSKYQPLPLEQHACFGKLQNNIVMTEDLNTTITKILVNRIPKSAFVKHIVGRHAPVPAECNNNLLSDEDKNVINEIFASQESELLNIIKNVTVRPLNQCCEQKLKRLDGDFILICERSKVNFSLWQEERQFRVTGSRCYELYTYTRNKNPDWKKKCHGYFYPVNIKSEFTEYGRKTESSARNAFSEASHQKVVEIGLVISKQNPWLAYSPDGIIVNGDKPMELLEIKCPYKGKSMNVHEAIKYEFKSCLSIEGLHIRLKEKHKYFAQVQMGMAVLNLKNAQFVIYASYDKSIITINVPFKESFVMSMLKSLKETYYNIMLHEICENESVQL